MLDRKNFIKGLGVSMLALSFGLVSLATVAQAADKVLKIGFVGVTSGPAAAWGTSNVRSMQTRADWLNEKGGVKIGGDTYKINIITFDDKKDPKLAVAGFEKMAAEGVHYVVGPNTDDGAIPAYDVAVKRGIVYFPYAFAKQLYNKPDSNAYLAMIANYESGPTIYKWLKANKGVKKVAFVAATDSDPISQRDSGVAAAKAIGLEVVDGTTTYKSGTTDFNPILAPVVAKKPDLIVLSGVAPAAAPLLLKSARELGFKGLMSTETAQNASELKSAGDAANGFISLGGASTAELASDTMKEFVARYTKKFGVYDDESNTKVYALEYIVSVLQKNPKAIDNVEEFKKTANSFSMKNPFVKTDVPMTFVGKGYFGQKRQIFVPMVVNQYQNGEFKTLFIGKVD
ncbi:MAG: ABC transporter substrate-binding protein [Alphaproteobacteria bacterium]|nr:ABC transporter substrate-binding protein [Alphaproteobacteria bacterium]